MFRKRENLRHSENWRVQNLRQGCLLSWMVRVVWLLSEQRRRQNRENPSAKWKMRQHFWNAIMSPRTVRKNYFFRFYTVFQAKWHPKRSERRLWKMRRIGHNARSLHKIRLWKAVNVKQRFLKIINSLFVFERRIRLIWLIIVLMKDRRVRTSRCLYFLRFLEALETDIRTCVLILPATDGIILSFFEIRIFFFLQNSWFWIFPVSDILGLLLVEYLSIRLLARHSLHRKEKKAMNFGIFEKMILLCLKLICRIVFEKLFTFEFFFKIWRANRACYWALKACVFSPFCSLIMPLCQNGLKQTFWSGTSTCRRKMIFRFCQLVNYIW